MYRTYKFIAHESDKNGERHPHSVNLPRHVPGQKDVSGAALGPHVPAGGGKSLPADTSTWLTPNQVR